MDFQDSIRRLCPKPAWAHSVIPASISLPVQPLWAGTVPPDVVCAVAGAITAPRWLDALLYVKQQQSLYNAARPGILRHFGAVITTRSPLGGRHDTSFQDGDSTLKPYIVYHLSEYIQEGNNPLKNTHVIC